MTSITDLFRRGYLIRTLSIALIILVLVISWNFINLLNLSNAWFGQPGQVCPFHGKGSSAPINYEDLNRALTSTVTNILQTSQLKQQQSTLLNKQRNHQQMVNSTTAVKKMNSVGSGNSSTTINQNSTKAKSVAIANHGNMGKKPSNSTSIVGVKPIAAIVPSNKASNSTVNVKPKVSQISIKTGNSTVSRTSTGSISSGSKGIITRQDVKVSANLRQRRSLAANTDTTVTTKQSSQSLPNPSVIATAAAKVAASTAKKIVTSNPLMENTIVTTTVNEAAAIHNLPTFIQSIKACDPPFDHQLIIFCLDDAACKQCSLLHQKDHCLYMNLGISSDSLAPNKEESANRLDYFRLTYGRVYTSVLLSQMGVNVLPVDIDAIFLQNPFLPGNGLYEAPYDIAVVSDIKPFRFHKRDGIPLNGGFLFFPTATTGGSMATLSTTTNTLNKNDESKLSALNRLINGFIDNWLMGEEEDLEQSMKPISSSEGIVPPPQPLSLQHVLYARELLQAVWNKNCHPTSNEQLVFSSQLRTMYKRYHYQDKTFRPHMLSSNQYLNLCSAQCGTQGSIQRIKSYNDLQKLNNENVNNPLFYQCSKEGAKKWVYFHVACLNITGMPSQEVAPLKGELQKAFYRWAKGTLS